MIGLHPVEAHRRELRAKNPGADLTLITHKDNSVEWVDDSYFENIPKRLIKITPAADAAAAKYLSEKGDADAFNSKLDIDVLAGLRAAVRSLAAMESHDVTAEQVASAAAYFGYEIGMPILRGFVEKTCPPEYDVGGIAADLWGEACVHDGTFEDARWLVQRVRELEGNSEPPPSGASATPSSLLTGGVKLILGSSIEPKPYDWLWPGMLVRGKLHLIAGGPGCAKTTIALSFAATVTAGGLWPDGTRAPASDAIIWSSEDDVADTLVPRLRAAGADMGRIHFVKGADGSREFDPATDMAGLRAVAEKLGNVGLLIVDPIVCAVAGDSHKNAETRRGLQPLVDLAQSLNAALFGITHFTKGTAGRDPLERVTGSLAFGAVARIVFAAAKVKDEDSGDVERIFVRTKSNIGPDGGGFKFALKEDAPLPGYPSLTASAVQWGDALEGAAQDLLKEAENAGESSKSEDAAELIQETIRAKGGEASATDLHAALKGAGIGKHSRYRAIDGLLEQHRITRVRYSERGAWTYKFPVRVADASAFDPTANNGDLVGGAA